MNAGAYGSDWAAILERALVVSADGSGWLDARRARPLVPALRARPGQVVARVEYRLSPRPVEEIKAEVADLVARRKATQPTNKRTFGSVFKNPPGELGAGRHARALRAQGAPDRRRRRSRRGTRTSSRTPAARRAPTASR